MKVGTRCGYCLVHRGYLQIMRATSDEELRFDAINQVLKLLGASFASDAVPSHIGSKRDRLIQRITKCQDPYLEMKKQANKQAVLMLPQLEVMVESQPLSERFRMACKLACLGNIIEYDVPGHSHDIDGAVNNIETEELYIDDTDRYKKFLGYGRVLFLTDNAGEIAFDRLVVREIRRLGSKVIVAVKNGPSLNDALMEDALAVGMIEEADEVITTGTNAIGINLDEASERFLNIFYSADAMVSKGMANWETITEYPTPCPTLFLFRSKCEPVAASVGAPLNQNIAKFTPRDWCL